MIYRAATGEEERSRYIKSAGRNLNGILLRVMRPNDPKGEFNPQTKKMGSQREIGQDN
jgi:hypothetical protein